jgi:ABC-type phosphate transport system permease subunit
VSRKSALIVIIAVALLAVVAGIYTAKYLKKGEYEDFTVQEAADLIDKTPD